ncbi:rRNA pseudouridine synthase [Fertoebacter nigrum]|uniref:Pseudouridine synthase n=1 Tax=Fertoeibacter niger TaxID=2656921 RepID=A0A8X8GXE8_9RHOB|nr:pseudouridine synthase [Fertoeibacter niger]NUB46068.1 rRNA pseudouridine synthase [Fertoeibacter niger]
MTEPKKPAAPAATNAPEGERIAKVLSRAGVASRREAERMIELGQVAVNGKLIDSPALNVTAKDRITVDGKPLAAAEPARLWLYYKPEGLVTSASDEKGRDTVFDHLPEDLPRVMSVGRLDLNSEGLLLLTNDGELKRKLELPSTGWLRKYRVRIKGNPTDPDLEPLRRGITVEGETFQPMIVILDRIQGANAWLTVGLREGKNREIRRAIAAIGLTVNRLIRISYGPFRLGELQPGEVEEVKPRVLRDQLGLDPRSEEDEKPARKVVRSRPDAAGKAAKPGAAPAAKPAARAGWATAAPAKPGGIPPKAKSFVGRSPKPKLPATAPDAAETPAFRRKPVAAKSQTGARGMAPAKSATKPPGKPKPRG